VSPSFGSRTTNASALTTGRTVDAMSRSAELGAALLVAMGIASVMIPKIITPIAGQPRPRRPIGCGGAAGMPSSTHRVPSQNKKRLPSATRLTRRVPWLCGPASQRVCHFRGGRPDEHGQPRVHVRRITRVRFAASSGYRQLVRARTGHGLRPAIPAPCTSAVTQPVPLSSQKSCQAPSGAPRGTARAIV
jgi:hypothetical protein